MAETELLLNTNLQTSSSSCLNCHSTETNGLNLGASGDFSDQLNSSLNKISTNNGEGLPINGKNLPEAINHELLQPIELKNFESNLKALLNNPQISTVDENALSESIDKITQNIFSENTIDLDSQIESLNLANIQTVPSIDNELVLNDQSEIQDVNTISSEIQEQLIVTPLQASNNQVISTSLKNADELTSITGVVDNQRVLNTVTSSVELEKHSIPGDSNVLDGEILNTSNSQKFEANGNAKDELNNFIAKYLSDEYDSKVNVKNQILSTEVFQQSINVVKTDTSLQNINLSNGVETYNNLSTGSLTNRPIESPIPLLVKQSASTEQIQQSVDQSIEQNVKWLISNKAQSAKINVFPESLGQVNIALNMEDSNLKLNFIASSNVTKELIESSVAALKQQFDESGINLQEVNVETRFSHQSDQDSRFSSSEEKDSNPFYNKFDLMNGNNDDLVSLEHVNNASSHYLLDAFA